MSATSKVEEEHFAVGEKQKNKKPPPFPLFFFLLFVFARMKWGLNQYGNENTFLTLVIFVIISLQKPSILWTQTMTKL